MIKHSAKETRLQEELRERRGWAVMQYRGFVRSLYQSWSLRLWCSNYWGLKFKEILEAQKENCSNFSELKGLKKIKNKLKPFKPS